MSLRQGTSLITHGSGALEEDHPTLIILKALNKGLTKIRKGDNTISSPK